MPSISNRRFSPAAGPRAVLLVALAAHGPWAAGCAHPPPTAPGLISFAARQRFAGTGSLQGGVFASGVGHSQARAVGGGAAHMDLYLTSRLSLPLDVQLGGEPSTAAARVGVRYRWRDRFALGVGVGPSTNAFTAKLIPDLELAVGRRWSRFALSLAFRPSVACHVGDHCQPTIWGVLDLSVAYFLTPRFAVTGHWIAVGGIYLGQPDEDEPQYLWGGGGGVGCLLSW